MKKRFLQIKPFFFANNVYFIKNTKIFSKKNFFFKLSFTIIEQPYTSERLLLFHMKIFNSFYSLTIFTKLYVKYASEGPSYHSAYLRPRVKKCHWRCSIEKDVIKDFA